MSKTGLLLNTTTIGITESTLIFIQRSINSEVKAEIHLRNLLFHRDDYNTMEIQNLDTPGMATHFKWEEVRKVDLNGCLAIKTPVDLIKYMNKTLYFSITTWIDDNIESKNFDLKNHQSIEIFNHPYPECWNEYLKTKRMRDNYIILKSIKYSPLMENGFMELHLEDLQNFKLKSGDERIFKTDNVFINKDKIERFIAEAKL